MWLVWSYNIFKFQKKVKSFLTFNLKINNRKAKEEQTVYKNVQEMFRWYTLNANEIDWNRKRGMKSRLVGIWLNKIWSRRQRIHNLPDIGVPGSWGYIDIRYNKLLHFILNSLMCYPCPSGTLDRFLPAQDSKATVNMGLTNSILSYIDGCSLAIIKWTVLNFHRKEGWIGTSTS